MIRKAVLPMFLIILFGFAEWTATDPLLQGHTGHVAVKLDNGDVLIIGGNGSKDCQLYDHVTATWSYTDSLSIGRQDFTAVLLDDGRVLVIGGGVPYSQGHGTCELYDPTSHTWSMTDTLNTTRGYARAVVLDDGRVLVTGGLDIMTLISASEIYDPTTETWTPTTSQPEAQWGHDMCLLDDGRVLSVGGFRDFGSNLAGCHIFDPSTETWTTTNPLNYRRWKLSAVKLITDDILVVGGQDNYFVNIPQCEIYNVATGTWTLTINNISPARIGHSCTKLPNPDPRVMLIGGEGAISDCEFFHAYAGAWEDTDALNPGRGNHAAALLDDGNILVVGGTPSDTDCQIFDPPPYGVSEHKSEKLISEFNAAPNPFTAETKIHYSLDKTSSVSLRVYNITGKLENILVNKTQISGTYTVEWCGENANSERLPAGVYFLELKTEEYNISRKVLLTN